MYKAYYWRYHGVYSEPFDTLEDAKTFLNEGASNGDMSHIGVVDTQSNLLWNMNSLYSDEQSKESTQERDAIQIDTIVFQDLWSD